MFFAYTILKYHFNVFILKTNTDLLTYTTLSSISLSQQTYKVVVFSFYPPTHDKLTLRIITGRGLLQMLQDSNKMGY